MRLKLRCSKDGKFGFVEKFKSYNYRTGAVTLTSLVRVGDRLAEPYVLRAGMFVPAAEIDKEMGIEKYIKAKKPFYSVLGSGNAILEARVSFNREDGSLNESGTHYSLYIPVKGSLEEESDNTFTVNANRITNTVPEIDEWVQGLLNDIVKFQQDRKLFLQYRF